MNKDIGSMTYLAAAAALAGLVGCSTHAARQSTTPQAPPKAASAADSGDVEEAKEPSMRGSMLHAVADLKAVRFDYDSSVLSAEARSLLGSNTAWLKDRPGLRVQVAGYCDPRGTEAYNLALGQRRAQAVRDYYRSRGVPGTMVATISYGKDKPRCSASTEACWSSERRAETEVAFPEDVSRAKGPRTR
jgi:peptidoglycan-associated lipoprotein